MRKLINGQFSIYDLSVFADSSCLTEWHLDCGRQSDDSVGGEGGGKNKRMDNQK